MTVVIHWEGLGKRYRRGLQVDAGLRHSLEAFVRSPVASTPARIKPNRPYLRRSNA
jgi:hypothetical protein